jgi:hypothetical protein
VASLGLVILAVALLLWGIFGDRSKLVQAGALLCAVAMTLSFTYELHRGHIGWAVLDAVLVVVNVFSFFANRSAQRKRAAA